MNLVAQILPLSNVVIDMDVSSKKRVFEQVGLLFENNHSIARAQVFDSLFAREKLGSTALGQGVAIPHGHVKGIKSAVGALVRAKVPIPFDAPDGQGVSLIFLLMVPERATDQHLQILSELAEMFSDPSFRGQMLAAASAADLHALITQWRSHAPDQHRTAV
ncbi:MAG: PTS sugar transporter subunit IIA [Betaproteobacteria bacterium]|nr:PTS sugar transporter subunit IIA [Betaproteobacteria bacterium]